MEEEDWKEVPWKKTFRKKVSENCRLKGPLRLARLCLLSIIVPGILIAGPLYLRYRVYSGQVYPVGMTDMRLVDNRISTTWCQKQLVKSNATFNAYLLPSEPQMKPNPVLVSTVRHLDLGDDTKEYWGFYLLKGSSFTVSTCCRWPGAFLTVIRGHRHLRECSYFGDDSSEEEEELDRIDRDEERKREEEKIDEEEEEAASNEPWMMKKARPGVVFHEMDQQNNFVKHRLSREIEGDNRNEHPIDGWLPMRSKKNKISKKNRMTIGPKTEETMTKTIDSDAERESMEDVYREILNNLRKLGHRGKDVLHLLKEEVEKAMGEQGELDGTSKTRRDAIWHEMRDGFNRNDEDRDAAEEEQEEEENLGYEEVRGIFNETNLNDRSESEFWSSFSSSEERLLNCAGLIVNLPLVPMKGCLPDEPEEIQSKAGLANKFTYKVANNGYYFFVFSSENEIQTNHIRVHFQFEKTVYNVSNPVAACTNATNSCSLPLDFFSREKTVLEMPLVPDDTLWNQEFVVVSVCEPRTAVYAACVVAVPLLILLFAF